VKPVGSSAGKSWDQPTEVIAGDMKEIPSDKRAEDHLRLSLEQKIMRLVRRYRAAEKRRKQKDAVRSKRLRRMILSALTVILLPSLGIIFGHSSAGVNQDKPGVSETARGLDGGR
jgi:hypothetical protein